MTIEGHFIPGRHVPESIEGGKIVVPVMASIPQRQRWWKTAMAESAPTIEAWAAKVLDAHCHHMKEFQDEES